MKTNFFDIALALGWRAARIFRGGSEMRLEAL